MVLRVFGLGLPKSGTTTLQDSFLKAGLKSLHWHTESVDKYAGNSMYSRWFKGEDIMSDFPDLDAVTQPDLMTKTTSFWPQMDPAMLRGLSAQNKDLKFILNFRDPQHIANSMEKWGNFMERLYNVGAPGMPPRCATTKRRVIQWIEGHYKNTMDLFDGAENFMTYEIEDAEANVRIGEFIGTKLDWWGHSNKTSSASEKHGFVE